MAIIRLDRPQTALEALSAQVPGLLDSIERSKRIQGERLQVTSVMDAIGSSPEAETPEELQQRIIGGFQTMRSKHRADTALGRVLQKFDPRVPSFPGVTSMEREIVNRALNRAFEDPSTRRTRELNLSTAETRAEFAGPQAEATLERTEASTEALRRGRTDRGFTAGELSLRTPALQAAMDSVEASFTPGWTSRRTGEFLDAFRTHVIDQPTSKWAELNDAERTQIWQRYTAIIGREKELKRSGGEISFKPTSEGVRKFEKKFILGGKGTTGNLLPVGITPGMLAEVAAREGSAKVFDLVGRYNEPGADRAAIGAELEAMVRPEEIPTVESVQEALKLKPGTRFFDANGIERVR